MTAPPEPLLPQIIPGGTTVLEIGCGSGRDIVQLNALGVRVTGLEPSEKLLGEARKLHPEIAERIFSGFFPGGIPELPTDSFDTILLSAVLMHIPDSVLFDTVLNLRGLLNPGGRVIVSVPLERGDIRAGTDRTTDGRLMVLRPVSRIITNRWVTLQLLYADEAHSCFC